MSPSLRTIPKARLGLLALAVLLASPALAGRKILRLRFDRPLVEAPVPNAEFAALFGGKPPRTLYDCVRQIRKAAESPDIAGLVMIVEQPEMNLAQVEEVTRALRAFRDAGKKVYCYTDYAGNLSYALACAADHITLAEYSQISTTGLHAEVSFYKGLLDKIGVQAQMMHCGAYKAALEPFTRTEPSKEFAENINWLLDDIYARWIELIATGRGLDPQRVRELVDQAPLFADQAREAGLVDAVGSFGDFRKMIRKEFGQDVEVLKSLKDKERPEIDFSNPFAVFEMLNEMFSMAKEARSGQPGVGLIYIQGAITVGENDESPFAAGQVAGSTTLRAAFEKARGDERIRAVVVRVDSPGGSALASDIIWKAARRCAEEKPLIVSMGGVAGSGGYYVSLPGDVIFAEPTTITASIGVVGGKLVWKELWEDKLGVTTTEFDRGKHAGLMSFNRPWTPGEREFMRNWLLAVYEQFKQRVITSRGDRLKGTLEELAEGRVFTGRQALERGLVDRLGGLQDALAYAAERADLPEDYKVYVLPEPKDMFTELMRAITGQEGEDEFEIVAPRLRMQDPLAGALLPLVKELSPQRAQMLRGDLFNLMIIQRETVGCFIPFSLRVR